MLNVCVVSAFEDSVVVGGNVFGNDISVTMSIRALVNTSSARVSATVRLCSQQLRTCTPSLYVVHEAVFKIEPSSCRSRKIVMSMYYNC